MPCSWLTLRMSVKISSAVLVSRLPGRLIGQHQRRPTDQRAGDGDALLLPARQAPRVLVDAVAEADRGQGFGAARRISRVRRGWSAPAPS
jgi:hypothetical protein